MSILLREENDYSTNKAPRLPICICIDTSSAVPMSTLEDIKAFLKMISAYIMENSECRAKVQLCVVTFGETATVIKNFGAVEDTDYELTANAGEPDLTAALTKCVALLNERIRVYKSESISHYLPEVLLLSSGRSTSDISEIAKKLCVAQLSNRLSILPFHIVDNDSALLSDLTNDGIVYTELSNFTNIFHCLKSSLGLLSASSATACASLKSQAVGWDQFVKER